MYVQIITFELNGIPDEDYRRSTEKSAPNFVGVPGLLQKVWLGDAASNTYGGIYVWSSQEAMTAYMETGLARLRANPALKNVTSRELDVIESATSVTSDLLRPVK
jgi:hypothetical protein